MKVCCDYHAQFVALGQVFNGDDIFTHALYRINKGLFHPIEDHHPYEHHHHHKARAISQPQPVCVASAQEARAEGLDNRRDGVYLRDPAPFFRDR